MRWLQVEEPPAAAHVLVLSPGEETVGALTGFARTREIGAAQVTAVGAFERAVVGWYDREAREYRPIRVDEQCELLSLVGDVAVGDEGPVPHLHAVLGLRDGTTRGGHLLEGWVWPTVELVVRSSPATLRKTYRPDAGLALIDLAHRESRTG
ncbi:PPC domain-containing DNA-binding protein [Streptomyces aidingensis]|uniref:PPC domain-containing protein n=1 Tax=Streptomyces aidingensis TaxID=910347 RepID=A0A1I1PKC3_9ACTN|nr:PPC domain-containing DNA-binding protein [Streptomyces aidingensis]SFD06450.1 hypothetical protein SAMN05421773_10952 [Streptomyces aidingensis]